MICDTSGYYPNVSYINLMMKQIPNFSAGKKKKKKQQLIMNWEKKSSMFDTFSIEQLDQT